MRKIKGFTLLEVMVAVAVLAIALSAIIKAAGESGANLSHLRDKTLAHWVAENRIAEMQAMETWSEGREQGSSKMADREWYWQVETKSTELPNMRQVVVQVSDREDRREWVTSLTGFIVDPELRKGTGGGSPQPGGEDDGGGDDDQSGGDDTGSGGDDAGSGGDDTGSDGDSGTETGGEE